MGNENGATCRREPAGENIAEIARAVAPSADPIPANKREVEFEPAIEETRQGDLVGKLRVGLARPKSTQVLNVKVGRTCSSMV